VTTFRYALPEACLVRLILYDVVGRQVRVLTQEQKPEGYHAAVWDGRNDAGVEVASGVYFARMQAGAYVETQSMVLLR